MLLMDDYVSLHLDSTSNMLIMLIWWIYVDKFGNYDKQICELYYYRSYRKVEN